MSEKIEIIQKGSVVHPEVKVVPIDKIEKMSVIEKSDRQVGFRDLGGRALDGIKVSPNFNPNNLNADVVVENNNSRLAA